MRRRRTGAVLACAVLALLPASTGAQTDVSGQVESTLALEVTGRTATLSTTEGGAAVTVTPSGGAPRTVRTFKRPVVRASVRLAAPDTEPQTITAGPAGP
ncbi:hypothetical protein [Conexibacter sp. SYSU D00693]|uniref:hypothetical protein n=1 Tax=Conexibacter sp. SYSU D00693 TaxID=2812560 RepID=UPI00196B218A|nr:hypothetical protein [Conexibacter sp. SYSU D00693]